MKISQFAGRFMIGAALLLMTASAARAEHIFLKDGKIISGKIAAENDAAITLILKDGARRTVARRDVLRMLYSEDFLTKLVIRLTNGDEFEGFIVDETRENYTIRKKLFEPEEQSISKERITYTAKKRPSELTGHAVSKGVEISWSKPLGNIKKFVIYVKKKGAEYKPFDDTRKTSIVLKGLDEGTEYKVSVRVVDDENYESPASNEITVRTLKKGEEAAELSREEKEKIEKMRKKEKESVKKQTGPLEDDTNIGISLRPSFVMPILEYRKTARYGIGAMGEIDWLHVGGSGFTLGLQAGVWYMLPSGDTKSLLVAPFTLHFGYEFNLAPWFRLVPVLDAGYSYNKLTYEYFDLFKVLLFGPFQKQSKTRSAFNPIGLAGLRFLFLVTDHVGIGINGQYGMIFESSGQLHLVSLAADMTFRF